MIVLPDPGSALTMANTKDQLPCGSFWTAGNEGNQCILLELLKAIYFIVILKSHHCIPQVDRIFLCAGILR